MTGHGRGQAARGGISAEVEVNSVNRKQLDCSVSLPPVLGALAPRVEEDIRGVLSRGRVGVTVGVQWSAAWRRKSLRVDEDLAEACVHALRKTARRIGLRGDFSPDVLLQLPEVVRFEPAAREADQAWPVIREALRLALGGLVRMRGREGAVLRRDIEKRLKSMEADLSAVRARAPEVVKQYRAKLAARLRDAGFDKEAADERVLRELALFADRADIAEELTRLASHIGQARRMLRDGGAAGRSLDFLAQEMLREAATIGSKANDAAIARRVVNLKAELERLREQVQNIE
ncbi:MAG TPA: YicC family protein [Kiritimatiellia bacterium]|nr:YicC family protein [Kiritimatiellia bacterium]HSA17313.1 YicC family protein [Kiritimatiellia bacterium]